MKGSVLEMTRVVEPGLTGKSLGSFLLVLVSEISDERSRVKGSVLETTRVVEPGLTGTRHADLLVPVSEISDDATSKGLCWT